MPEASSDSECDCKRVSGHSVAWGSTLKSGAKADGKGPSLVNLQLHKGKIREGRGSGHCTYTLAVTLDNVGKKANCVFSPSTKFSLMNQ